MSKHCIYKIIFGVITFRIISRLCQEFKHLNPVFFNDAALWMALAGVIVVHLSLLVFSSSSEKFKGFSAFFLYINFVLFLYMLFLLSGLIHFSAAILISSAIIMTGVWLYWPLKFKRNPMHFVMEDLLIGLWLTHSLLLLMERNFIPGRQMYQDEASFWAVAAKNMIDLGVLQAHAVAYPGGGLHPFGVPFLTALPVLVMRSLPAAAIFFMPVVVIAGIFLFLNKIKHQRWLFIFFLAAVFVVFNNRSWMGCLMYQLVYGDGISTVILLWFTYEILHHDFKPKAHLMIGAFFIGLLALTKSPLTLTFLPFLAVFLTKHKKGHSWLLMAAAVIAAFFPSMVWALFVKIFHIDHYKVDLTLGQLMGRLPSPNTHFLQLAFKDMWINAKNFVYLGTYALALFILFSRKYLEAVPTLFLMGGVVLYYAYYYAYGSIGDYSSFLRYMMPVSLSLFYLGARGFNDVMIGIDNSRMAGPFKVLLMLSFAGLFVYKLF